MHYITRKLDAYTGTTASSLPDALGAVNECNPQYKCSNSHDPDLLFVATRERTTTPA